MSRLEHEDAKDGRIEIEDASTEETKDPETSEEIKEVIKEDEPADPDGNGTADEPDPEKEGDVKESSQKKEEELTRSEKKVLKKKDEEIADLTDRYKRTLAEYENFRKRTEKEKSDIYTFAVRDVLTKVLPVLDNLERGIQSLTDEQKKEPVAQGMDKIEKQFVKTLDDLGVKEIEAEGKTFDPDLHNAVMHVEDESLGENIVAEVFQKGYTYRGSVIRHSMVKVAN